jgi:hypothetical protein
MISRALSARSLKFVKGLIIEHPNTYSSIIPAATGRNFLSLVDTLEDAPNPLIELREMAQAKNLCDEHGFRVPRKHFAFVISASVDSIDQPPKLKTLNFQRVSKEGIDFVTRKCAHSIFNKKPVSFLYTDGQYKPGQTVVQWRADGVCQKINLEDVLAYIPEYSITEMVATDRARKECNVSVERQTIEGAKSHFTELVQQARIDLENSNIYLKELNGCIQAWRFVPTVMEKMKGGPDEIMWDRLEFRKEGSSGWSESRQLMPY